MVKCLNLILSINNQNKENPTHPFEENIENLFLVLLLPYLTVAVTSWRT